MEIKQKNFGRRTKEKGRFLFTKTLRNRFRIIEKKKYFCSKFQNKRVNTTMSTTTTNYENEVALQTQTRRAAVEFINIVNDLWYDKSIELVLFRNQLVDKRASEVLNLINWIGVAIVLLSIFGSTVTNLIIIIAVLDSTRVFRLTRAVSINVVVMDYVEAARLRGEGLAWIMRREILPNIMPPLIAEFGLRFCFVFLTIAALSFLGVGIQPPTADWGSMVRENASLIQFAQYDIKAGLTPLLPAAAIALLTVAVNFVVDWFLHKTSGIRDEQ